MNPSLVRACLTFALLLAPALAQAQSPAVGAGPLTTPLADTEPTVGVLRVGPVRLAPGITVREIGTDSNVFDEAVNPVSDFVITALPDVAAYSRMRFLQLSGYAAGEWKYFKQYEDERSFGHILRGRMDLLLSRLRPFVGLAEIQTRERPNGEIDVRADRIDDELSGGVAVDASPTTVVYGSAYHLSTEYSDAFEDGVDLRATLSRDTYDVSAGYRTALTPLLSMTMSGSWQEDRFKFEPLRNSESVLVSASFSFDPDAVVAGGVVMQYRDFKPENPGVKPYKGPLGQASLTYSLLEVGRFAGTVARRLEYSFDSAEAYYIENSFGLSYTHLIAGPFDVRVQGGYSKFNYGNTFDTPEHTSTLDSVGGSVGYNLRNRTRIAMNYEYARRRSPELPERNYDRRRVYLSWMYAF